jgi:hypothetical protein
MSSELLLAICAAAGVMVDLACRLVAHLDDLRISVQPRLLFAQTTEGGEGVRVLIRNRGRYPANIDWLRIESSAAALRLPLHDRPPISRGSSDSCALAFEDLFRAGFRRGDRIRANIVLDLGHEFRSPWLRLTQQMSLARITPARFGGGGA